jgi:hypothetical protein
VRATTPDQVTRLSSERRANLELVPPALHPHEEQVRHVGARDQQHETRGSELVQSIRFVPSTRVYCSRTTSAKKRGSRMNEGYACREEVRELTDAPFEIGTRLIDHRTTAERYRRDSR